MDPSRRAAVAARLTALGALFFVAPAVTTAGGARIGQYCQAAPAEPKSLAFVVARVERRPAGEFVLTFENGEVWQQDDRRAKMDIQRGEQVVIRRSASGTFTLVARDGQSARVKRVH
jgi:hypothetical protein